MIIEKKEPQWKRVFCFLPLNVYDPGNGKEFTAWLQHIWIKWNYSAQQYMGYTDEDYRKRSESN